MTKTYLLGFNHDTEQPYRKLGAKDQIFLEIFCVKYSNNFVGQHDHTNLKRPTIFVNSIDV